MSRIIHPVPRIEFAPLKSIKERRKVALVHSRAGLDAVRDRLKLKIASEVEATEATEEHFNELAEKADGKVVYAVGGGLAADAGKFVAAKKNLPFVCIPTAISVDAFFTPTSAVRQDGTVRYIETKPAETVVIDLEVIAAAPAEIRAAGICDLLSIVTARWDWKYADDQEANPQGMGFIEYADHVARALLRGAMECASAAGKGDPSGIKQLVDCLALEVLLCNQLGHSRPEEGSEHYFAYAAENYAGPGRSHAELVGPGILTIAQIQGHETASLRRTLEACHVPLDRLSGDVVQRTLNDLPEYCKRHKFPHGIAHDLNERLIAKVA